MRSNRESCRKIWSRRPPIPPKLVDRSVQIYNGKTPVRCKITEGKVGHKSGEFSFARKCHIKIYGAPRIEGRRGKGHR